MQITLVPDYIPNKRQHLSEAEENRKRQIQAERQRQAAERKAYRDKLQKEEDAVKAAWDWFGPEPKHQDILQICQHEKEAATATEVMQSPLPEVVTLDKPEGPTFTKHTCLNYSQMEIKESELLEEIKAMEKQLEEIEMEEAQHAQVLPVLTVKVEEKENSPVQTSQEVGTMQEPKVYAQTVPKCRKCRHKGHNVAQCPRKLKGKRVGVEGA